MSTIREVHDLIERMRRIMHRATISPGAGEVWEAELSGYGCQSYRLTGMLSPTATEDNLANLGIWVWSAKDYFKIYEQRS